MLATGGKSGLKPQGTISSAKQLRVDQKKYVFNSVAVLLEFRIVETIFEPQTQCHIR